MCDFTQSEMVQELESRLSQGLYAQYSNDCKSDEPQATYVARARARPRDFVARNLPSHFARGW